MQQLLAAFPKRDTPATAPTASPATGGFLLAGGGTLAAAAATAAAATASPAVPAATTAPSAGGNAGSGNGRSAMWEGKDWGPPEIQVEELEYLEKIGGGCFGSVYRGRCRGKEVAIKKLFRQDVDEKTLADFRKEVQIMSQLRHPNVLLFMGACTTPGRMALVTELMPRGNVSTLLHDPTAELSLYRRLQMARDAALGINWLHCSNPIIVHRDLKPSNLLLDEHLAVKVCDFGLSAVKPRGDKLQDKGGIPGTPLWMAPEVLLGRPLDEKSDVYSFGILLWEIVTRREPFEHMDSFKEFKRAVCRDNERPELPRGLHPRLATLMQSSWDREPSRRPPMASVLRELEHILVEVGIPRDDGAVRLWSSNFLGRDRVTWSEFVPALCRHGDIGAPSPDNVQFKCLRAVLAEKSRAEDGTEQVGCEQLGKVAAWFGPLDPVSDFLQRLQATLQQPGFHGAIEKSDSEALLSGTAEGTYLVRLSTTALGAFTISKVAKTRKVNHQRIDHHPDRGFSLQLPASPDGGVRDVLERAPLHDFLQRYAKDLFLVTPLPCPRFRALFENTNSEGYLLPVPDYEEDENALLPNGGVLSAAGGGGRTVPDDRPR